jgi:hypothetical protein
MAAAAKSMFVADDAFRFLIDRADAAAGQAWPAGIARSRDRRMQCRWTPTSAVPGPAMPVSGVGAIAMGGLINRAWGAANKPVKFISHQPSLLPAKGRHDDFDLMKALAVQYKDLQRRVGSK